MGMPQLCLAFRAVFWRVFLLSFAIQQYTAFHKTRHFLRHAPGATKLAAFLDFMPKALVLGFFVAALVTVVLDLLVRFVARPAVARWYLPVGTGSDRTPLSFRLGWSERLVAECPARQREAHGWRPGTLVLTNRALEFYPTEWDLEPWIVGRSRLRSLQVLPSKAAFGSFVLGVPGRLSIRDQGGQEACFALADPRHVLSWFDPGEAIVEQLTTAADDRDNTQGSVDFDTTATDPTDDFGDE